MTQPIEKILEEFSEKYCRKSRNPENLGEPIDHWFFPEELTPFEVKSFLKQSLEKVYAGREKDLVERIEGMTEMVLDSGADGFISKAEVLQAIKGN